MNPFEETEEIQNKEITSLIEIWIEPCGRNKKTFISGWNLSDTELKEHISIIKKKLATGGTLLKKVSDDKIVLSKIIQLNGDCVDYMYNYLKEQMIEPNLIRIKG